MKQRTVSSVHIPIAQLMAEVADIPLSAAEGQGNPYERWLISFARALCYNDPTLHPFAARLLAEAGNFMAEASQRSRAAAEERWRRERENAGASGSMRAHAGASGRMGSHQHASEGMRPDAHTKHTKHSSKKKTRSVQGEGSSSRGGNRTRAGGAA